MRDKKVLVAGTGRSGICATGLLIRNGARVIVFDQNEKADVDKFLSNFSNTEKIKVIIGNLNKEDYEGVDLMVISPGIPTDAPFVNEIRDAGIPIWSEIELAYYFNKGKIAAITGTNGKTTTTSLVGEIFKTYQENSIVVGNIGLPFTKLADATDENTLISVEISSFQLQTIHEFRPHCAAILNLTPDHLDRHYTFDNYCRAKYDITNNMTADDYIVLNNDDPETKKRADFVVNAKIIWFSRVEEIEGGVYVKDGKIIVDDNGKKIEVLSLSQIRIPGAHNVENVLAAVALTYYMGVPTEVIRKAVSGFMGVEHRIEFVKTVKGVDYYNDSKGTNPDAAIKGIGAMTKPTFLIGGGYDKHNEFDEWIDAFDNKVKYLILIGQTAEKIANCARKHGFNNIVYMTDLTDTLDFCYQNARPGDCVLLSPACASWGMFKDYEQRGEIFKQIVNSFEE